MDDFDLNARVEELNKGAKLMDDAATDEGKLPGASIVTRVGREIVEHGGLDLLHEAHRLVDPSRQRTVELQWYGLSDGDRIWLP